MLSYYVLLYCFVLDVKSLLCLGLNLKLACLLRAPAYGVLTS